MNLIAIKNLMTGVLSSFAGQVLVILSAVIGVAIAYFLFKFAFHLIWHFDGTTNWLGSHWSWYDHQTYKPYKGYNRILRR